MYLVATAAAHSLAGLAATVVGLLRVVTTGLAAFVSVVSHYNDCDYNVCKEKKINK